MKALFVDKTIEIDAPVSKVWNVLTKPENTDVWAPEFTGGTPFHISSDWQSGSPVLWKDNEDKVLVEGKVTMVEKDTLLRFTVSDTSSEKNSVSDEDGITYQLTDNNGKTILHIRQGDFSIIPDGERYFIATEQIWDRVLPKVKKLAENSK